MYKPRYSVILGNVGSCMDRYVGGGYGAKFTVDELFSRVASIEGVSGVELVGTWHITPETAADVKKQLDRTGLELISIIPDHFGEAKWGKGAFSSKDAGIRREAVESACALMDVSSSLGCNLISLWPGQDGFDYPFQGDYIRERTWFEEGVARLCEYNRNMKIAIEYKPKEPRTHSYPANVYSALMIVQSIGAANCGVTIDYGHALVAGENVAESVAVLKKYGDKLFHVHMNDCYGYWDDDMITGSIHTIPYVEFFYWLKKTGYTDWVSTDQYPYREDGRNAVNESIRWFDIFVEIVNRIDEKEMDDMLSRGDACEMSAYLRELLFGHLNDRS